MPKTRNHSFIMKRISNHFHFSLRVWNKRQRILRPISKEHLKSTATKLMEKKKK